METQTRHVFPRDEFAVPVAEMNFEPELMFLKGARQTLAEQLTNAYKARKDATGKPGYVVVIKASTAGSPVIRALLELYKTVTANGRPGDRCCPLPNVTGS